MSNEDESRDQNHIEPTISASEADVRNDASIIKTQDDC